MVAMLLSTNSKARLRISSSLLPTNQTGNTAENEWAPIAFTDEVIFNSERVFAEKAGADKSLAAETWIWPILIRRSKMSLDQEIE